MAPTGPQLPPCMLDKRKRAEENTHDDSDSSSDGDPGPAPPEHAQSAAPKRARVIGPSLPPPSATIPSATDIDKESDTSGSDNDEFGPSLPTTNPESSNNATASAISNLNGPTVSTTAPKRDDWMMVPPTGGDWSARIDPTKLKNRKFNTGKGAKAPAASSGGASDAWHETPQEKQARLQREMMGIKDSSARPASTPDTSEKIDPETVKRLQEYNKSRGPTLYEAHQNSEQVEKDDDPSARAFDREKDIGAGFQVNATQRRDMMKKASDFNSRFSSARYL